MVPSEPELGEYVTEQLPPLRVQLAGVNTPETYDAKLTLPVGVTGLLTSSPVTVAVQVVSAPTGTDAGEHVKLVEVV